MANIIEPTEEKLKELEEWIKDRPQIIKDLYTRYPSYKLYQLDSDGCSKCLKRKVTIHSYNIDGTITVNVPRAFNISLTDVSVPNIPPEQLTECDIPTEEELKIIQYGNKCLSELNDSMMVKSEIDN